jgi:uncharacterized protein
MPRRDGYEPGTFCWVDLSTTDTGAAKEFYGGLFGWTVRDVPDYGFFLLGDAVVAGLSELQPDQRQAGMPPSWSSYVRVDRSDEVAARAAQLGGTVLAAPFAIPDAGRMAVLADPLGAIFLLWEPDPFPGAEVVNEPGSLTWNDLQTPDPAGVAEFYRGLFGWEIAEVPGSGGSYFSIANRGRLNGGIMRPPGGLARPFWNAYFGVDDLDAALARVTEAGGEPVVGPMEVPAGRFAGVRDPQGAFFSLFQGEFDD